jgi:hypothetical protein
MGSIISGIGSLIGGQQASSYDKAASDTAKQAYSYARSDLSPYNTAGQTAMTNALSVANSGQTGGGPDYVSQAAANQPGSVVTDQTVQNMPGYNFWLDQGLKSTQSANAAKGLGVSGAALKGAGTYATGLANSYYQSAYNDAQTNFQDSLNLNTAQQGNLTNQYNRYYQLANLGESAAASTAQAGTSAASTSATAQESAGNALSSGTKGLATGLGNALNDYLGYSKSTGGYASGGGGGSSDG